MSNCTLLVGFPKVCVSLLTRYYYLHITELLSSWNITISHIDALTVPAASSAVDTLAVMTHLLAWPCGLAAAPSRVQPRTPQALRAQLDCVWPCVYTAGHHCMSSNSLPTRALHCLAARGCIACIWRQQQGASRSASASWQY